MQKSRDEVMESLNALREFVFDDELMDRIDFSQAAYAWNARSFIETLDAIAEFPGWDFVKEWSSSYDGYECLVCKELDGSQLELFDLFPVGEGILFPPAHDECRCVLKYIERQDSNL